MKKTSFKPEDPLLSEQDVADWLGVSRAKLQRDRWAGTGIPYLKIGHHVRYRTSDVKNYLSSREKKACA